jgi:seryl-tRNA synthetase
MPNVQSANVKPELANTKSTHASKAKNTASHKAITHKVKHPNVDKTELKFKKARKISKSIKRIESEMSDIQSQMTKIGKDLNNLLHLMQEKGTTQVSNKKHQS